MFRWSTIIALLVLAAGVASAQYDEIWEMELENPRDVFLIGIGKMSPDTAMQMVFVDGLYRTDQYKYIRIVNAATGDEEWESDEFYFVYTDAPNQPRLVDVDGDGMQELLMLVEYDPGYAVWTLYDYIGGAKGKLSSRKLHVAKEPARGKVTKGAGGTVK